ncbi:LamG-like jellyroll fold domain-containing protein [Nonomuraea bangladeshensis]|uniref:LamG-like jellyroll fold domain-containing protein n=1 Tax=Nonomuraea bangladeshensis TaxID=404385 RepID=UPI003C2F57DC
MTDAAAANNPDTGKIGQAAIRVDGDAAVLTADAGFLADPAVTYPVTVETASEEWVGTGIDGDTHVSQVRPDGELNSTLTWMHAGRSHSGAQTHRAYFRFNIRGTPLEGGTVSNADFRLFNYNSHDCSDTGNPGIELRQITDDWSIQSLTWSNQPSTEINGHVGNKGAYDVDCPEGEGELYYSIEQIVQGWMNGVPDRGIRLGSPIESEAQNWRTYRSYEYGGYDTYPFTPRGPVLFIEYTPPERENSAVYWGLPDGTITDEVLSDYGTEVTDTQLPPPAMNRRQATAEAQAQEGFLEIDPDSMSVPEGLTDEQIAIDLDPDRLPTETPPEQLPPYVTATVPDSDATNVPLNSTVRVTFNRSVTEAQIVVKDPQGVAVPGSASMDPANLVLTFMPTAPWTATTTYTAQVSGAKDELGDTMAAHTWSFITGVDTPPPVPGLVAAYGMNEGTGTSVTDSSGQNNTGTGTGTTWANGKYGQALSFNGTSSRVNVADAASLRLTAGMTLSAWVNPASVSAWSPVVGKELSSEAVSYTLYASNGSAPSGWVQTDPVTSSTINGTSLLPVGTWSHVALSYDGAALRLFVNGRQVAQTALTGSLYDDGGPLRIGGNAAWNEYFRGLIDEVRIYNRAQTAAQIQADMNAPIGGQPTPDTQAPSVPGSLAATGGSGSTQLTWTASTDNVGVDGYRIHRSPTPGFTPSEANQVGSSPTATFTEAGLAAGTYYYRVRAFDAAGNLSPSSNEVSATVTTPPANPGLVAAYGMNEATGTTVGDSSGQNNTGAARDTSWAAGRHGGALSFNGVTSWVTVPHAASLRLASTLTLSAWVRPSALGSLWRTVLMKERAGGGAYGLYASTETSGPGGWLQTTEETAGIGSRTALPLNQWSHVALTYDGATAVVYVNGTELGQVPVVGEVVDDAGVLRIGGNSSWGEFYSGLIDEVRVYNRVQSAAEIQTDMNTPIGAAAATSSVAQRQGIGAADIVKLTVDGSRTVDGVTVASTLTPQLTTWLATGHDGEAKVEVEIARQSGKGKLAKPGKGKLAKTDQTAEDKHQIWTGQAATKPGDSRVTLQVPKDRLRDGEKARWRARLTGSGASGIWSRWHVLTVDVTETSTSAQRTDAERTSAYANAANNFNYDRITSPSDCLSHPTALYQAPNPRLNKPAKNPTGFTKNHFSYCISDQPSIVGVDSRGRPTGNRVDFDIVLIGRTFQGSRTIEYDLYVQKMLVAGSRWQNSVFIIDMVGTGDPNPRVCQPVAGGGFQLAYSGNQWWWPGKKVSFKFESSDSGWMPGPDNREAIGHCVSKIRLDVAGDPQKSNNLGPKQVVRCDSFDANVWYPKGCIFDHLVPSIMLKQTVFPNAYQHISLAYLQPSLTTPTASAAVIGKTWPQHVPLTTPKKFPGFSKSSPVHRNYWDENRIDRNRDRSERICGYDHTSSWNGRHPVPWDTSVEECDEFPFASTFEGAWVSWQKDKPDDQCCTYNPGVNISVKLIPRQENRDWGTAASLAGLGRFYFNDRILDEDPFFLRLYDVSGKLINP